MICVLTGDIINSRGIKPDTWMSVLKNALETIEADTSKWEIYRGDSFQIELSDIEESFINAVYIKACIKTQHDLDVRIAIGIGEKSFEGTTVSESNGQVFQFSGETLEKLKQEKTNLKLKTSQPHLDRQLNLMFKLASVAMDNWTQNSAEIVKLAIERPDASQEDIGRSIDINQTAVSRRQQRAHLDLVLELDGYYRQQLQQLS